MIQTLGHRFVTFGIGKEQFYASGVVHVFLATSQTLVLKFGVIAGKQYHYKFWQLDAIVQLLIITSSILLTFFQVTCKH